MLDYVLVCPHWSYLLALTCYGRLAQEETRTPAAIVHQTKGSTFYEDAQPDIAVIGSGVVPWLAAWKAN